MKVAYHNILHTTWLISQSYRKGLKKMSQAVGILPNNSANACFDEASGVRWCRHRLSRCVVAASVAAVGVFRCRRLRAAPDERLRLLKRLSSTLVDASFEDEVTAASADRRLRLSSSILSFDNSRPGTNSEHIFLLQLMAALIMPWHLLHVHSSNLHNKHNSRLQQMWMV